MSFVGKIKNFFYGSNIDSLVLAGGFSFGTGDRQKYVQQGYLMNPYVYSAVNIITNAAKQVPFNVYRVTDQKAFSKYKSLPAYSNSGLSAKQAVLKERSMEEVEGTGINEVMKYPNPNQGWGEWFEAAIGYKLITGESFIHGIKTDSGNNAGAIREMWVLPSQFVEISATNVIEPVITGYELKIFEGLKLEPDEVMHWKYFNPSYDGTKEETLHGLSPLTAAFREALISNGTGDSIGSIMDNAGASGVLSLQDAGAMNEEQAKKLRDTYYKNYTGKNRGKIIITAANLKWQEIGMSPKDMQVVDIRKMSMRDIYAVYGLKSELGNDSENSTYNNVSEANRSLYLNRVLPELDTIRDELNRWLADSWNQARGTNYYIDYDISGIPALQDDMKLLVESIQKAWWTTGNEKRMFTGFGKRDDMDKIFLPTNIVPYEDDMLDEDAAKQILANYAESTNGN